MVSKKIKKLLVLGLILLFTITLCSCGEEEGIDLYGFYDDITNTCKLTTKYTETSSFLTDGIGPAIITSYTDGDTTNFRLPGGQNIIIRYYGIDTPESTGSVQKWGKAASQFVKETLSAATSVVLEATSVPAVHDSYGTRYLGYVWYRLDETSDYKCLNLEIVENGLSANKCINTSDYKYYSYFKQAEDFAKGNKLRVHGDYTDPLYSTEAEKITLKDFFDNTDAYYNSDADAGSKVRIQAYITDLYVSNTGTYTFTATQNVDGKLYSINIYAGYSSAPAANNIFIGNKYSITGNIALHNKEWQISGITYVAMQSGGDYLTRLQKNYYCTFNSDTEYKSMWGTSLFSDVTVESAKVEGTTLTIVGFTMQNSADGYRDSETYTFTCAVEDGYDASGLVGKTFKATGIQEVKDSKQISSEFKDLIFK